LVARGDAEESRLLKRQPHAVQSNCPLVALSISRSQLTPSHSKMTAPSSCTCLAHKAMAPLSLKIRLPLHCV
jgi:hypothetical protein